MADEYIRKQDAIDAVEQANGNITWADRDNCKKRLEDLPPADVAPVVHSQWKYKCGEIQCPECGNKIHRIDLSGCLNFCPNCGAKMDGGENG